MAYAENTKVPVSQSIEELKRLLSKQGAGEFGYAEKPGWMAVQFELRERRFIFKVQTPTVTSPEITRRYSYTQQRVTAVEQFQRARWRQLLLVIKAKLQSVELGIESFEEAFMANLLLPSGETMGEWMGEQLDTIYLDGRMPSLMHGMPIALSDGRRG